MNIKNEFFLFICLATLLVVGCNQPVNNTAVITSNLALDSRSVRVSHVGEGILDTLGGENKVSLLSYTLKQPLILTLTQGRSNNYVFVSPGDSVTLEKGEEGGPSIVVSQANSAENAFLTDFAKLQGGLEKDFGLMKIAGYEVDSFQLKMVEKYKGLDALLEQIQASTEVGAYFKKVLHVRLAAMKGTDLLNYKSFYAYLKKEDPVLPEDYYAFLDDKFYDNPSLLLFAEGRSFGDQLVNKDLDFTTFPGVKEFFEATFEETKKVFSAPLVQNYYQFSAVDNQINFGSGLDGADKMIAEYESRVNNSYLRESLTATIEPWLNIRKGMAAPDFAGMTRDGKKVNISELKGKSVYVDVWATWCGPCIREIPSLKKLEKDLHDTNVEFVSISIDQEKDKQKWLDFIKKEALGGTQLMAEGDWKSTVTQEYNIQGIPRFLLIDAEGKIVSANAPRPSSEETKELIQSNS